MLTKTVFTMVLAFTLGLWSQTPAHAQEQPAASAGEALKSIIEFRLKELVDLREKNEVIENWNTKHGDTFTRLETIIKTLTTKTIVEKDLNQSKKNARAKTQGEFGFKGLEDLDARKLTRKLDHAEGLMQEIMGDKDELEEVKGYAKKMLGLIAKTKEMIDAARKDLPGIEEKKSESGWVVNRKKPHPTDSLEELLASLKTAKDTVELSPDQQVCQVNIDKVEEFITANEKRIAKEIPKMITDAKAAYEAEKKPFDVKKTAALADVKRLYAIKAIHGASGEHEKTADKLKVASEADADSKKGGADILADAAKEATISEANRQMRVADGRAYMEAANWRTKAIREELDKFADFTLIRGENELLDTDTLRIDGEKRKVKEVIESIKSNMVYGFSMQDYATLTHPKMARVVDEIGKVDEIVADATALMDVMLGTKALTKELSISNVTVYAKKLDPLKGRVMDKTIETIQKSMGATLEMDKRANLKVWKKSHDDALSAHAEAIEKSKKARQKYYADALSAHTEAIEKSKKAFEDNARIADTTYSNDMKPVEEKKRNTSAIAEQEMKKALARRNELATDKSTAQKCLTARKSLDMDAASLSEKPHKVIRKDSDKVHGDAMKLIEQTGTISSLKQGRPMASTPE